MRWQWRIELDTLIDFAVPIFFGLVAFMLVAVLLVGLFVYFPAQLYAESQCLRLGYPVAHVTIGLERYCSNLEGVVTIRVDKQ